VRVCDFYAVHSRKWVRGKAHAATLLNQRRQTQAHTRTTVTSDAPSLFEPSRSDFSNINNDMIQGCVFGALGGRSMSPFPLGRGREQCTI
jgi:hypothetical protein